MFERGNPIRYEDPDGHILWAPLLIAGGYYLTRFLVSPVGQELVNNAVQWVTEQTGKLLYEGGVEIKDATVEYITSDVDVSEYSDMSNQGTAYPEYGEIDMDNEVTQQMTEELLAEEPDEDNADGLRIKKPSDVDNLEYLYSQNGQLLGKGNGITWFFGSFEDLLKHIYPEGDGGGDGDS